MQRNKKSCGHMECGDGPHNQNQYMAMLKRSFHNSKIENKHLAEENAALKEELARQTSSWKEEKSKLLEDRVTSVLRVQEDLDDMAAKVKMSKARQKEIEMELGHMALKIKGKDMDVRNFNEHLRKKEAVIQELEAHILQRDSLWQHSVSALEQRLTCDQEANGTKEGELEKKLTEAEERRLTSRLDAQCQVNKMEEDISLLILKNKELQELTAMSDKDKARRQKEKKAAEREEEERQKRASKAWRQKEREKMQREEEEETKAMKGEEKRLKRESKERREQEKKEKVEREEEEKREKKEMKKRGEEKKQQRNN